GFLFLAAGEVVERVGRRGIADLADQLSFPVAFGLAVGTWAIAGLPPLAGFVAKNVIIQSAPGWAKTVLLFLGMGTAASFAKLIPLFQPRGRGRAGGVWLLSAAVIMFGLGGIVANPRLFGWPAWGEAILAAGGGYALYLGLRTVRPGLPRFTFDRALVSILAGAVVLAGLIALS
ncbi:MAG: proton-conducting transporter membrane subunit, partial [Candidatus Bipolaricaulaceae bacterium]